MNRLKVLAKIDELEAKYKIVSQKAQKQIDKQIAELGQKLLSNPRKTKRLETLKSKGSELTYQEIMELMKIYNFTQLQIAKIVGIKTERLREFLVSHGYEIRKFKKGEKEMAQGNVEEAKRLLKETDLTVPQIAEKTGVKQPTVYYHQNNIRGKKKATPKPDPTATIQNEKNKELQEAIIQKDKRIEQLQRDLEVAEREIEGLRSDAIHYSKLYEQEAEAHEHLWNYIGILRQRGNE